MVTLSWLPCAVVMVVTVTMVVMVTVVFIVTVHDCHGNVTAYNDPTLHYIKVLLNSQATWALT